VFSILWSPIFETDNSTSVLAAKMCTNSDKYSLYIIFLSLVLISVPYQEGDHRKLDKFQTQNLNQKSKLFDSIFSLTVAGFELLILGI
jgi:hypothetical protein